MFAKHSLTGLLVAGLIAASSASSAKIYKYIDANGNVVYSETKPNNVQAQELKPKVRKVSPDAARKQLDALGEKASNAGKNREAMQKSKSEMEALARRETENCATARENLQVLQSSPRVQAPDAQGNLFVLDDAAIQAKTAEAQEQIRKYCK